MTLLTFTCHEAFIWASDTLSKKNCKPGQKRREHFCFAKQWNKQSIFVLVATSNIDLFLNTKVFCLKFFLKSTYGIEVWFGCVRFFSTKFICLCARFGCLSLIITFACVECRSQLREENTFCFNRAHFHNVSGFVSYPKQNISRSMFTNMGRGQRGQQNRVFSSVWQQNMIFARVCQQNTIFSSVCQQNSIFSSACQ